MKLPEISSASEQASARRLLLINLAIPLLQVPFVAYAVYLSNSVVILADALGVAIGAIEMGLVWLIHRYAATAGAVRRDRFQYGFGKLENLTVLVVCALEALLSVLILFAAIESFRNPQPLSGAGFGIVVLVGATSVHLGVLVAYRDLFRASASPIVRSFRALMPIYILNNVVVLIPIVLGTFIDSRILSLYADPVGAVVLVCFAWVQVYRLATRSVTCLVDRAVDEQVQLLILRVLADHFDSFETVHEIRTRTAGEDIHVDINMAFDRTMPVSELEAVISSMTARAAELVPNIRVMITPVPPVVPSAG